MTQYLDEYLDEAIKKMLDFDEDMRPIFMRLKKEFRKTKHAPSSDIKSKMESTVYDIELVLDWVEEAIETYEAYKLLVKRKNKEGGNHETDE